MANWQGQLVATLSKYVKGKVDAIEKKSVAFAMLKNKGRITTGTANSGIQTEWNVQYRMPTTNSYEDMQVRTFSRPSTMKRATLPWCSYDCCFALSKEDRLKNRGEQQMTNLWQVTMDAAVKSMERKFQTDVYADGNGGSANIHGFNSWFGVGATLSNGAFNPSDTYAGISTALGAYGGSAPSSGTWPSGLPSAEYDFWSPMILSSTSSAFGSSATWLANCADILRKAKVWSDRNMSDGLVDTFITTGDYYEALSAKLELKEQVIVNPNSPAVKLGFPVITFHGMEVLHEPFCPNATGYGINFSVLELMSLQDELFPVEAEVYSETDKSWRMGLDFYGQMKSESIRSHFKVAELGS